MHIRAVVNIVFEIAMSFYPSRTSIEKIMQIKAEAAKLIAAKAF